MKERNDSSNRVRLLFHLRVDYLDLIFEPSSDLVMKDKEAYIVFCDSFLSKLDSALILRFLLLVFEDHCLSEGMDFAISIIP